MVDLDLLDDEDVDWLRGIVTQHLEVTGSEVAERLLSRLVAQRRARSRRCSRRTTSGCSKPSATRWSAASTPTKRSWRRRVGETTGFMKYERELPTRRPIPVRVLDWQEVYEDFPPEKVRTQGARCMDCGIPFCHTGCPLGNLIPEWNDLVYRDRLAGRERAAARDQQLPRVHRPALPGAVRGRVRARHQRAAGHDQADRGRDRRPRVGRGLGRAGGRRRCKTGKRVAVVGSGPAGLAAAQQLTRAGHDVDRLRARRPHRRAAALRHPRVQDGEAPPRPARRADGRPRAPSSARTRTSARTCRSSEICDVRRGRARGRRDGVARPAGSRARARRHLPGDGVPAVGEPRAGGRPRRAADHRRRASTS